MRQALAALAACVPHVPEAVFNQADAAMHGLREALENPSALRHVEPVAWTLTKTLDKRETTTTGHLWFKNPVNACWSALYAAPVERKPLSDDEILVIGKAIGNRVDAYDDGIEFARAIIAAYNIKVVA